MDDKDFEHAIMKRIAEAIPSLPEGSYWKKYGKTRIYFNTSNRRTENDYSFHVELTNLPIELINFQKNYWLPQLEVHSVEEFTEIVENIYYELEHPISEPLPINTTFEMKIHRRFESEIDEETLEKSEEFTVEPIPLEISVEVSKEDFKEIQNTGRTTDKGNSIYRFQIKYEALQKVINQIKDIEDDEDEAFMKKLMRDTYGK